MKLDSVNGHIIISLVLLVSSIVVIHFGIDSDIPVAVAGLALGRLTSALDKAGDKQ